MAPQSITKGPSAEWPFDFLPFDQMEIGGLIAEASMARGTPGLGLILHREMQGSSHAGLDFIAACNARMTH